ncbi:MAG: tetratricopeptide repeat protein [Planctomycetaceae bacterium]|nr:tetratricopeptide repeat protein [Planctomycetales bacterium]MCB9923899.1 tetratricopeptide repeat protein [Planctomycetaceae bacterium]
MGAPTPRQPSLDSLYQRYLNHEDSATFISAVASTYTIGTIERLAEFGQFTSRRAATMALGFLGDYRSNDVMGRRLSDKDRGVRMLAENSIRELWYRDGNETQRKTLQVIIRLNNAEQAGTATRLASELIDEAPFFAEAWSQRAIAHFQRGRFDDSANDCFQTLELNPYHFASAVGMGHCYLELNEPQPALDCFRRALKLNPGLEDVRAQVTYLERALEGR